MPSVERHVQETPTACRIGFLDDYVDEPVDFPGMPDAIQGEVGCGPHGPVPVTETLVESCCQVVCPWKDLGRYAGGFPELG